MQWRMIFSTNDAGTTGHPLAKNKSGHRPYTLYKNNFKRITDLNVKCKTIKLLEDNIGENLALDMAMTFNIQHQRHDL